MKYSIILLLLLFPVFTVSAQNNNDIPLSKHPETLNVDVMKAFEQRQTIRNYTNQKLSKKDLSLILWAANGINRPSGKRTAPTAHGIQYINIYVTGDDGNYFYDAINNRLVFKNDQKAKNKIANQNHVREASHVIILTADLKRVPGLMSNRANKLKWAYITAGTIAQNIYLMSAAKGIGTCLVGGINARNIQQILGLSDTEIPILVMPLGYPGK